MMFNTVSRVRVFNSYHDALKAHADIKPIRGRGQELRPLAERRHADKYHIRLNDTYNSKHPAVELMLYQTPVVTWIYDGEGSQGQVQITCGRWPSTMTCHFIQACLPNIVRSVSRKGKSLMLSFWNNDQPDFLLAEDEKIILSKTHYSDNKWVIIDSPDVVNYEWRIDRKGSNAVLRRYKDTLDFVNGALNTATIPSTPEFAELSTSLLLEVPDATYPFRDDNFIRVRGLIEKQATCNKYKPLLEDKFKALCLGAWLSTAEHLAWEFVYRGRYEDEFNNSTLRINKAKFVDSLKKFILYCHPTEVFDRVPVPRHKLPSKKHNDWLSNGGSEHDDAQNI